MLRLFIISVLAAVVCQLDAQTLRRNGLKIDVGSTWQRRIGLVYERRVTQSSGFEVQAGYTHHNPTSTSFFNGSYRMEYAWREVSMTSADNVESKVSEGYFGSGRPLPQLPAGIVQLSTIQAGFAYRASYGNTPQFRLFLQPSLHVMRHRYAEARDYILVLQKETEKWITGATLADGSISRQTTHYRQTRDMRVHNRWYGGVAYDIGLACTLKNGLHLEGGAGLGINVGNTAYEKPKMPFALNGVHLRYMLRAGYFFGKIREAQPAVEN